MSDLFSKTRFFWAISRIFFSILVCWDSFTTLKNHPESSNLWVNGLIFAYTICLVIIAVNEFRKKDTNELFLLLVGVGSMIFAVLLVPLTIGSLKSGFGILLCFVFIWMVFVGLKDIMGNHFYVKD
ncbi:hypothetical protein [Flavobacterium sp.]|uniref:hypothetical protein n=1 Tax=Flavobacterium sp. TaxID=239 RepID=UPI003D119393